MAFALSTITVREAQALHRLIGTWERFWKVPAVLSIDEIVEDFFEHPRINPAADLRVVWDGERRAMIGFGKVEALPIGNELQPVHLWGVVHPHNHGQGIGRRLMGWQINRAKEILDDSSSHMEKLLRCDEFGWIESAHKLYRRYGFTEARRFEEMVLELMTPPSSRATGVTIVPWNPDRTEEIRLLHNAAFADHWGSTPQTEEDFRMSTESRVARLGQSLMAVEGERIIGFLRTDHYPADEEVLGTRDAWIASLAVRRDRRGRGVATALISAALDLYRRAGYTHAKLGVDSASPTGATRLYRRLGFETFAETITHTRSP